MLELKYSLIIEATEDPTFFGFYSPDLEGFTGVGHSIEYGWNLHLHLSWQPIEQFAAHVIADGKNIHPGIQQHKEKAHGAGKTR